MVNEKLLDLQEITKRLDVIINLLLKQNNEMKTKEMIAKLRDTGLQSSEIAGILHKTPNFVSKELSLLKKATKKSHKGVKNC